MLRKMLVVAALLSVAAVSSPASACSAPACAAVSFVPQSVETADEIPVVPENGATLAIERWSGAVRSSTVRATIVRDGASTEVELTADGPVVHLDGALEGDVWTVRETHACTDSLQSQEGTTTVRIGPPADAPTTLGTLHADAPVRREVTVADASGPCSSTIDSIAVDLHVTLDEHTDAWGALLRYETLVDGEVFLHGTSTLGGSVPAVVFVACEAPTPGQLVSDLEEGTHVVQRRAFLPGSDEPIASDEIEIELDCGDVEEPDEEVPPASPVVSVCSVSSPGARASSGAFALLAAAMIALGVRRRRA
ncbi:hypothetical protein [Sandaracinus amylolyticus]|uniref:hypothetical protein n=1 Tax=Sandaracinus amylolyticus TaxID=927083 RepID=UPI001F218FF5|nr:hypothetical protein [Sandaracinus amylolyticus]UJR84966.1 Hypothetical protein I5071_70450 [Sandaracinus amylolyticus]